MTGILTTFAQFDGNIFLTGFMGTGKTSVGRLLASRLHWSYIDLDERIVSRVGMAITDIFATMGEAAFRVLEHETLRDLLEDTRVVVATGGGVVIDGDNRRMMHDAGLIVNLTASVDGIVARLAGDDSRPLLKDTDLRSKAAAMLAEREKFYADADLRVDTTGKTIDDIANEILVRLNLISRKKVLV